MQNALTFTDYGRILSDAGLLVQQGNAASATKAALRVTTQFAEVTPEQALLVYKGVKFDPHQNLTKLTTKPACVILQDATFCQGLGTIPWLLVSDAREAWAHLAAAEWGNPERSLEIIGITGTNGKTSTTWLLRDLLQKLTHKPSFSIGTVGAYLGADFVPTQHTTPDPPELFSILAKAKERGQTYGAMEVSSHALCQGKLGPIRFAGAGFTSFSRDHLDFHGTMEEYLGAKWRLFSQFLKRREAPCGFSSDVWPQLGGKTMPEQSFVYGLTETDVGKTQLPQFVMRVLTADAFGCEVSWESPDKVLQRACVPFLGDYAVKNLALALRLAELVTKQSVTAQQLASVPPVPGRLEPVIASGGQRIAYVDYAHTPDALEKVLQLLRAVTRRRLITVFGCGGGRDKGKRPEMGAIAARLSDVVIVTSDNPRTESPEQIVRDILQGIPAEKARTQPVGARVIVAVDRRDAIRQGCELLAQRDVLLVAGKGHETYQIIGTEKLPFDDRFEVAEAMRKQAN